MVSVRTCAAPQSARGGQEDSVEQHELETPEFPCGHTARAYCQAQDGERSHERAQQVERVRSQLAQDHVQAPQIGEEQQAKSPLPLLVTDAVGSLSHPFDHAEDQRAPAQAMQELLPALHRRRGALDPQKQCEARQTRHQTDAHPQPNGVGAAGLNAQFALDNRKGDHRTSTATIASHSLPRGH